VFLKAGTTLSLQLAGQTAGPTVSLLRPGTRSIDTVLGVPAKPLLRVTANTFSAKRASYRAPAKGWYYLQVAAPPGQSGTYALTLSKQRTLGP
jgi:hypothetical protein